MKRSLPIWLGGKKYIGVTDAAEIVGVHPGTIGGWLKREETAFGFKLDVVSDPTLGRRLLETDAKLLSDLKPLLKSGQRPGQRMFDRLPEHVQKICLERPAKLNRRFPGFLPRVLP